jgi:hypothetical protein
MSRGLVKVVLLAIPVLLLIGLGLTAVTRWRETANRTRCQDNLRRLGWFAMWQYTDRDFAFPKGANPADRVTVLPDKGIAPNKTFPPGTLANTALPPEKRLSWQVILLPHVGREDVYKQFDLAKAWDDDTNHAAIVTKVPVLACPTLYRVPPPDEPQLVAYVGLAGLGADAAKLPPTDPRAGFFRYDEPTTTGMLKRGLSNTMTITESSRQPGPWAAGGPTTVRGIDPDDTPYIGIGRQFGGHPTVGTNPAGGYAAYADGSVRFVANSIDAKVFEKLVTLAERGDD